MTPIEREEQSLRGPLSPEQQREHEYHQDTVRMVLLRMDPAIIATQMLPSDAVVDRAIGDFATSPSADLEDTILNKLCSPLPEVTTMIWEAKASGKDVVNPDQIMLVGGGGKKVDPNHPIKSKDLIKTAKKEAIAEVHLVAHELEVIEEGHYIYSFPHPRLPDTGKPGRLKNTTHLVVAYAAPHDAVQFFDPQDKLQAVLSLTPSGVSQLLKDEVFKASDGRSFSLLDSLSKDEYRQKTARVISHSGAHHFKETVEKQGYIYESRVMRKIIDHLALVPHHEIKGTARKRIATYLGNPNPKTKQEAIYDLKKAQAILMRIENSYSDTSQLPVQYISESAYDRLVTSGIRPHKLKSRMKLISDLALAARWVAEDLTAEYYAGTGSQFPLLLSQMLSEFPSWSTHDYELISRSGNLKHIVDVACGIFDVNPATENWHGRLRKKFQKYQRLELEKPIDYAQISAQIAHDFCNPTDPTVHAIKDPIKLGTLSTKVESFLERNFEPLAPVTDAVTRSLLRPKSLGSTTSEIPELLMLMFGIDQYTGKNVVPAERNAAMRKLVEMIRFDRVDQRRLLKLSTQIKPLREALDALIGEKVDVIKSPAGVFELHTISRDIISLYKDRIQLPETVVEGIDISEFDIPVAFKVRVKEDVSDYRKELERGGIDPPEEDMSDTFGFMMGLDQHRFKREVHVRYPFISKHTMSLVTQYWKQWASQFILETIMIREIDNRSGLNPIFRLYKGRADGVAMSSIADSLHIESQERGSASSNAKWEWIKYVMAMTDDTNTTFQVEIQHFPSIEDMVKKKLDDPNYDLERLFQHAEGRYPLVRVLYGKQETYDDVMRGYNQRRSREKAQLPWRERFYLWIFHWMKEHGGGDVLPVII